MYEAPLLGHFELVISEVLQVALATIGAAEVAALSICVNFITVAMVTFVSVWGGGKALRGQDGSMDTAVDGMNNERAFIFTSFGVGVLATLGCLFAAAHVLMEPEIAMVASCLILGTVYLVISEARRIHDRFYLEADETISFAELRVMYPKVPSAASVGLGTPPRVDASEKDV